MAFLTILYGELKRYLVVKYFPFINKLGINLFLIINLTQDPSIRFSPVCSNCRNPSYLHVPVKSLTMSHHLVESDHLIAAPKLMKNSFVYSDSSAVATFQRSFRRALHSNDIVLTMTCFSFST